MKIGIIGQGFVGNAVYQKFKNYYNVLTYDLQAKLCNSSLEEVYECDHIFICLPSCVCICICIYIYIFIYLCVLYSHISVDECSSFGDAFLLSGIMHV